MTFCLSVRRAGRACGKLSSFAKPPLKFSRVLTGPRPIRWRHGGARTRHEGVIKLGNVVCRLGLLVCVSLACAGMAAAQEASGAAEDQEFGPVVRAYLGYLRAQQEVTDDSVSRHEISPAYYRRNSNRIRALRRTAIRLARERDDDYLPELEAVARDEFSQLFEQPPAPESLRVGAILNNVLRFLGTVRSGNEKFYLFARLDQYEQAELEKKSKAGAPSSATTQHNQELTRPRRVNTP